MRRLVLAAATPVVGAAALLVAAGPAFADHGHGKIHRFQHIKLTGAQEVPPADRDGKGTFVSKADLKRKKLCYALKVRKIATPTAAHIHKAPRGVNGPVTVGLNVPASGFSRGCIKAVPDRKQTAGNAAMVLTFSEFRGIVRHSKNYYVNVHNERFPGGAIRGQLR